MPFSVKPLAALLTLVLAAPLPALAMNDWSIPCTKGKCSWDLPAETGASGSVKIWGPENAISDITSAAGWQIITTCNMTNSNQVIQLVCEDDNPNCNQLFQGNGAVNTIVRLPESCGPNPFARVAQHQVLQSNLVTRVDGSETPIHQLTLDTNFAAVVPSQGSEVYFSLHGQNGQGNLNTVSRRNLQRFRPLARQSWNDSIVYPINFSGKGNLFSNGSSSIDIDANLQASINITAVAAGTISPPNITQLEIIIGLGGNANATLSVSGNISGKVSSPNIPLYQTGIPGLNYDGILDIGPEFVLFSRIDAEFTIKNVSAAVEANYKFGGASVFPPSQAGSKISGITSSSGQMKFSDNPDVGAALGLAAHVIPQVNIGLNALENTASASVYLNFDASLGLQGSASSTKKPQPCLSGKAEINVEVGTQGSFFYIFSDSMGKSLFDKNFTLFQHCFAGNSSLSSSNFQNSSPPNSSLPNSSLPTQFVPHAYLLFTCLGFLFPYLR